MLENQGITSNSNQLSSKTLSSNTNREARHLTNAIMMQATNQTANNNTSIQQVINNQHKFANPSRSSSNSSSSPDAILANFPLANFQQPANISLLAQFTSRLNLCTLSSQHAHSGNSLYDYVVQNRTSELDLSELKWAPDVERMGDIEANVTRELTSGVESAPREEMINSPSSKETALATASKNDESFARVSHQSRSLYQAESYDHKDSYEYDSSDDDESSDEDDHDHNHHGSKYGGKKHGKKKKVKKYKVGKKKPKKQKHKKVVYTVKMAPKKKKHHQHHAKVLYGKAYYPAKVSHKNKHNKKVTYAYVYEEPDNKDHYASKYNYHEHGDHKSHGHHYSKHPYHGHHKSSGKAGHSKGRVSVAGLFGYTLLCVNYLMMMKEPDHYDHHHASSHYHSMHHSSKNHHYSSHDHKKGGAILLAHCYALEAIADHQQQVLLRKRRDLDHIIESVEAAQRALDKKQDGTDSTSKTNNSTDNKLIKQSSDRLLSPGLQNYLGQIVYQQQQQRQQQQQQQDDGQAEVFVLGGGSSGALTTGSINSINSGDVDSGAVIVETSGGRVGGVNRQAARLLAGNGLGRVNPLQLQLAGLQALDPNGPELIGRRDNLVSARSRQVDVSLRVTGRSRFAMAPLTNDGATADQPGLGPVGVVAIGGGGAAGLLQAIQQTATPNNRGLTTTTIVNGRLRDQSLNSIEVEGMVADQPSVENPPASGGGLVLDLPEYVLSGDSIELTCNHRMPLNRIYSVKWFKDSLEFYRFIPANGPGRAKSFLPLAELRLDMARSNSESLSLRNVSHLSTGLYRCEVVSEGPNFETRVGEKRMQVYSLPNNGPQLTLLDRAELLMPVMPAGDIGEQNNEPLVRINGRPNNNLLDMNLFDGMQQPPNNRLQSLNNMRAQVVMGPLVRCQSARSYPAAELRLTINGQELAPSRLLENSTLAYSDFTESNLVTFRLALSDFVQTPLDRAASLKSSPPSSRNSSSSSSDSAAAKLTLPDTPRAQPVKVQPQPYANALVQFNDRNVGMTKEDFRPASKSRQQANNQNSSNPLKSSPASQSQNLKRSGKQQADNKQQTDRVTGSTSAAKRQPAFNNRPAPQGPQASSPVAVPDKSNVDSPANRASVVGADNQEDPEQQFAPTAPMATALDSNKQMQTGNEANYQHQPATLASLQHRLAGSKQTNGEQQAEIRKLIRRNVGPASDLNRHEQRIRSTIGSQAADEQQVNNNNNNRQPPISYSNYIRIKCTSLVGQVRYEMSSELSVPLSVLAGQAIAAANQAQSTFGANNNNGLQSRPGSVILNGADRVAQASHFQAPTHRAPSSVAFASAQGVGGGGGGEKLWRQANASSTTASLQAPVNVTTNYNPTTTNAAASSKQSSRGFHLGSNSAGRLHQTSDFNLRSHRLQQQAAKSGTTKSTDLISWTALATCLITGLANGIFTHTIIKLPQA